MRPKAILISVLFFTIILTGIWQFTGGDYYTKFEVIEQIQREIDPSDPLASAGFYDDNTTTETVVKSEFRFGLLPTPRSIFDKHTLSVSSIAGPAWLIAFGFLWMYKRKSG